MPTYTIRINEHQRKLLLDTLRSANADPADLGDWAEIELIKGMLCDIASEPDVAEDPLMIHDFTS